MFLYSIGLHRISGIPAINHCNIYLMTFFFFKFGIARNGWQALYVSFSKEPNE